MPSVRIPGVPRLLADGRDISASIQYRKGWALIGYLAIERGRRHSCEHVDQLLWPALAPAAARTNLRQVIANFNRVFERHGAADLLDPRARCHRGGRRGHAARRRAPASASTLDDVAAFVEPEGGPILAPTANAVRARFVDDLGALGTRGTGVRTARAAIGLRATFEAW